MRTIISAIGLAAMMFGTTQIVMASVVDITAVTNKTSYLIGEDIEIFITAYNPNPEPVALAFSTSMQASYLMDDTYNWKDHHGSYQVVTQQQIDAFDSYTWTLVHGTYEFIDYLPTIGSHTILGEILGYGQSTPVEFEVVPEPSTLVLLGLGFVPILRQRHYIRRYARIVGIYLPARHRRVKGG